jgi:hypothetical protein
VGFGLRVLNQVPGDYAEFKDASVRPGTEGGE